MPDFYLGARSQSKLDGVHPDLVAVVKRAIEITEVDFTVIEGLRSVEEERVNVASGHSETMHSRHLDGHAVDLGAWVAGKVNWEWSYYEKISAAMKQAANELSVPIEWGGDWHTLKDGAHFQLPWAQYPSAKS